MFFLSVFLSLFFFCFCEYGSLKWKPSIQTISFMGSTPFIIVPHSFLLYPFVKAPNFLLMFNSFYVHWNLIFSLITKICYFTWAYPSSNTSPFSCFLFFLNKTFCFLMNVTWAIAVFFLILISVYRILIDNVCHMTLFCSLQNLVFILSKLTNFHVVVFIFGGLWYGLSLHLSTLMPPEDCGQLQYPLCDILCSRLSNVSGLHI